MKVRIVDILKIIKEKNNVSVNEIAEITNLSTTSVRRYLIKLEKDGLVIRNHGGVRIAKREEEISMPVEYKSDVAIVAKEKIAKYAASLMKDDSLVFLDSGSSMIPIAKYISADVMIVTLNLSLAIELGKHGIKSFLLPGYVNSKGESVYSEETLDFVSKMHFDQSFVSTTGFSLEDGFTCHRFGSIKRTCLLNGVEKYILCDSTKFRRAVASKIADLDEVVVITEDRADYLPKAKNVIEVQ